MPALSCLGETEVERDPDQLAAIDDALRVWLEV
jgi:hypothetical protein